MVQSVLPSFKSGSSRSPRKEGRSAGLEIALPLTLLAFVLASDQSPLLKMHMDHVIDWLCDHDFVADAVGWLLAGIPLWMLSSMIADKLKRS